MTFKSFLILLITLLTISCSSINTSKYFRLKPDEVTRYSAVFIKNKNDTEYKRMESIFGTIGNSYIVKDSYRLQTKTIDIEGEKVYYVIKQNDSTTKIPDFSLKHFLGSAMIFKKDKILLAPITEQKELADLSIDNFKYELPLLVKQADTINIHEAYPKVHVFGFKKEPITIDGKNHNNSLTFSMSYQWPDTTLTSKVWLSKKYGLLKWKRTTGREETRLF